MLIIDTIYIFDGYGNEILNYTFNENFNAEYFTLSAHKIIQEYNIGYYYFLLGYIDKNELKLNLYYYSLDNSTKIINIISSIINYENSMKNTGISCEFVFYELNEYICCLYEVTKTVFLIGWDNDIIISFFQIEENSISFHKNKDYDKLNLLYIRSITKSPNAKSFFCGLNTDDKSICLIYDYYDTLNSGFYFDDGNTKSCLNAPYNIKTYYFPKTGEYVFSCLTTSYGIQTTIYNKNMAVSSDIENPSMRLERTFEGCKQFYYYSIIYSEVKQKYYIISDMECGTLGHFFPLIEGDDDDLEQLSEEIIEENIEENNSEKELKYENNRKNEEEQSYEEHIEEKTIKEIKEEEKEINKQENENVLKQGEIEKEKTLNVEEELEEEKESENSKSNSNEKEKEENKEDNEKKENSTENNIYICQLEKCYECNNESELLNLCKKCNIEKYYYPLNSALNLEKNKYINCYNETTKPQGFYLDNIINEYKLCYSNYKTCNFSGDGKENNCTSCKSDLIFKPDYPNTTNCVIQCPYFYYYKNEQYKCTDAEICPDYYQLEIIDKMKCIDKCENDDTYTIQYDGECYKEPPEGTVYDEINKVSKDVDIINCKLNEKKLRLISNDNITEYEIKLKAKLYAEEFGYTNEHATIYKNEFYTITLYKDTKCLSELDLNIDEIDFGECYTKI